MATTDGPAGASKNGRTARLRELLSQPGCHQMPAFFDGLSAKLTEQAGFHIGFVSGFSVAAARGGCPDTGLLSYSEVLDSARSTVEATQTMPIIADADTGYGNAVNVKRTVRGFAAAGCSGVMIEDQTWPKSCGHVKGKRVIPREEAVARVRAAVDARKEGADILIMARTDARQAESLEEAFARVNAFAEAGADILFIDALASEEELAAFCNLEGAAKGVPKMCNNLEGGGKTPLLPPQRLAELGFSLVVYPLSLMAVAAKAMQSALEDIKAGGVPGPDALPSFKEIQAIVGFPEYFVEEDRYAVSNGGATQ